MCLTVSVSDNVCAWRCLCLAVSVPGGVCAWRCLCLAVSVPGGVCAWRCLCLAVSVPGGVCAWRCLCLAVSVPGGVCVLQSPDYASPSILHFYLSFSFLPPINALFLPPNSFIAAMFFSVLFCPLATPRLCSYVGHACWSVHTLRPCSLAMHAS